MELILLLLNLLIGFVIGYSFRAAISEHRRVRACQCILSRDAFGDRDHIRQLGRVAGSGYDAKDPDRAPPSPPPCGSIVPTSDFSGLVSSICALASAVASAAIDGRLLCRRILVA
jgi:hypothetical protein